MAKSDVDVSKFLSLVLRHKPEEIGITLDEAGWADVDALLTACKQHGYEITVDNLQSIVANSDKQRFALSSDKQRIRANQGHSINTVKIDHVESKPPDVLYHGTATRFVESIRGQGLVKRDRLHVHLSSNIETARLVGERHGKLALLEIASAQMHRDGYIFYVSANGVWLTDEVPPSYITFSE